MNEIKYSSTPALSRVIIRALQLFNLIRKVKPLEAEQLLKTFSFTQFRFVWRTNKFFFLAQPVAEATLTATLLMLLAIEIYCANKQTSMRVISFRLFCFRSHLREWRMLMSHHIVSSQDIATAETERNVMRRDNVDPLEEEENNPNYS